MLLLAGHVSAAAATTIEKANAILAEVKTELAPDGRQVVDELKVIKSGNNLVLTGAVSEKSVYTEALQRLQAAGITVLDNATVYPSDRWALVRIPAASLRTAGRHAAEMSTQAVMGTPLRVLDTRGDFWRVQTPDGYIAYVPSSSVVEKTPAQMEQWRAAQRYIVTAPYQQRVYRTATDRGLRDVVTDVVNGVILEQNPEAESTPETLAVLLPDGRTGYIDREHVSTIEEWAGQPFDAEKILDIAYSMEGTPYLWGGTSVKALDCSGLAKVSYYANGIILMRDASQQAKTGFRIEPEDWHDCEAGDLLFFGNKNTGRVTHVAIYDHDGDYVHSSGRVKRNSIDPDSPAYLTTPFLHAVRIKGRIGTEGITAAKNHPWYF